MKNIVKPETYMIEANFKVLWLQIKCGGHMLYICNVYRPPSADDKIFLALATDIEKFQASSVKSKVFLFGDFNCHHSSWLGSTDLHGKGKTNSAGVACFTLCQTTGLKNVIKGNTNLINSGKVESTLALTDSRNEISRVSFENPVGATAHCRIVVELKFAPKSQYFYKDQLEIPSR